MIDQAILQFDRALRTVFAPAYSVRPLPGHELPDTALDDAERRHVVGLMRVDHCGEICAQALYQGQALTARDPAIRDALVHASDEETEHLAWTEQRIAALGGRKSLLNPLWYGGSLAIGLFAGCCGERWNLGFLAETERQVEAHLEGHLAALPSEDHKSRAIIEQMKQDESGHAETAVRLGAHELPTPVKLMMKLASAVMTRTAYRI
jgi:ubiquinone biosynthesis monooxygenase Coq7